MFVDVIGETVWRGDIKRYPTIVGVGHRFVNVLYSLEGTGSESMSQLDFTKA